MLHKAWNSKGEMPYRFPRSSVKCQGHTVQNITDFDPNWAFPDYRPVAAFKSLRFALFFFDENSVPSLNRKLHFQDLIQSYYDATTKPWVLLLPWHFILHQTGCHWCYLPFYGGKKRSKDSEVTLIHWGWETYICVSKLTSIGSDNCLVRWQAIIWTNAGILLIESWGTNFSEILIEIHTFSFIWKCCLENGGHFVLASMG